MLRQIKNTCLSPNWISSRIRWLHPRRDNHGHHFALGLTEDSRVPVILEEGSVVCFIAMLVKFEPLGEGLSETEQGRFYEQMIKCVVGIKCSFIVKPKDKPDEDGGVDEIEEEAKVVGTGFVVNESGTVVTVAHLFNNGLKNIPRLRISYYKKPFVPARVVIFARGNDIALVAPIKPKKRKFRRRGYRRFHDYASIGNDVFIGQQLYSICCPKIPYSFLDFRVTPPPPTFISDTNEMVDILPGSFAQYMKGDTRMIQLDGDIPSGASGSPLFNNKGEVLGLLKGDVLQLSYAIHFLDLDLYLDRYIPKPNSRRSKRKQKFEKKAWKRYKRRKLMSRQNMMANGSGSVSTIPPATSAMSSSSVVATETSVSGADQVVFVGAADSTKPMQVERVNKYNIEAEMVQNGSEKATYRKLMLSAGIKASFSGAVQGVFSAADDNTKPLLEERGNEHSTEAGMIQIGVEKATIEEFMASEGVQTSFSGKNCVVHSGADDSTKPLLGEGENQYIIEVEVVQNGAKNAKSEESMVTAGDSVPCLLTSSVMEGGDKVCSLISEENEKSVLGKQLKTMALEILNHTAQFDSAEDCGGSVSVGTLPPSTSAMSSASIAAAETLPGTDSQAPKEGIQVPDSVSTLYCDHQRLSNTNIHEVPSSKTLNECSKAEIEHCVSEIQSLQQTHTSALKASLDVVLQDRKKTEEIAEKMTSLSVRAPLKSFLAEPISDNWQEATALGDPILPTYEDGSLCKAQAKIVPTTTSPESFTNTGLKNYIHREGNSPAKLPKKEQKKRVRWPPFLCCLHVPSDRANLVGAH